MKTPQKITALTARQQPCLCISCPQCGAVFMAYALDKRYHDSDIIKDMMDSIADYARKGYSVSFKDANEFKIKYCEHIKIS